MRSQDTQAAAEPNDDGEPRLRASDADRDRVVELLNTSFAEGRLAADEHHERISAAYAARTWHELRPLTADLPVPRQAAARRPAVSASPGEVERCLRCALMIACPPAGIAWWYLSRRSVPDRHRALR